MNVALAGLTAREETALTMLVGKALPHFQCASVPTGRQVPLPPADLYVLDLTGRGLARWTQEAEERLLTSLNGAPAVLVVPAFDQTWQALDASRMKSQPLIMLHKPYGIEDMRAALVKAAPQKPAREARIAPAVPARAPTPVAPASTAVPVLVAPIAAPEPQSSAVAPIEITPLSVAEFQARVEAIPASEPKLFLCKLGEALMLRQSFEVRVTFVNRLIFNPDAQWAASNTALPLLRALCQGDALAANISIDDIDGNDALARAGRLDMPVQPLESLLGELMHLRLYRPADPVHGSK